MDKHDKADHTWLYLNNGVPCQSWVPIFERERETAKIKRTGDRTYSVMDLAIYNAVVSDDPVELKQLLQSGGNVNEFYQDYTLISAKSILHMSCEKGRIECVKVLLEMGADLTIADTWYQTPLMYCVGTQYDEIADLLLTNDPEIVDIGDKYGKTALHIAVERGAMDCVKVLLRHNAYVDVVNDFGVSPLMMACDSKEVPPDDVLEIVKLLLDHGADCNMKDHRNKRSALQNAMTTKHVEVTELLLANGADPNTIDSSGRCPISTLIWYHHGIDTSGDVDDDVMIIMIMLIQAGANLNITKFEQTNPLCMATRYRLTNVVAYFLANGADQNSAFYCNITPLMIATKNRDIKTLKVLLNYSSNLYRHGRVVYGELDYNTDVFHMALDIGAFEPAMLIAEAGYDMSRVDYLVDWTKSPTGSLVRDPGMLDFFRQQAMVVHTLRRLSVMTIRNRLTGYIPEKASDLPLPKPLLRIVSMTDELT